VISIPAIIVGEDEALDRAIKRFKRMVEKEGIVREWKRREFYEKPSSIRNRKKKALERKRLRKVRKIGRGKRE
jgi:small subunit ribosomal protein S21